MANVHTNLIVFALTVTIAQQTHLGCVWNDALNFNTNLMLGALLFPVVKSVVDHLVVEMFRHVGAATCAETEGLLCLL